jgi:nucleoside-diphosphate-sugar epimerase
MNENLSLKNHLEAVNPEAESMSGTGKVTAARAPSYYIEKVSLQTGEVLNEEIKPEQLLIHAHRDFHFMDFEARRIMSRIVRTTGDEEQAYAAVRRLRRWGYRITDWLARFIGELKAAAVAKKLFGLKHPAYYFRFKPLPLTGAALEEKVQQLRQAAQQQFARTLVDGQPRLRVLLTGGTGFIGQGILEQVTQDAAIAEVVVLIRPKAIIDHKTKQVVRTLSPAERGAELLQRLWLETPEQQAKFRFIAGDIEQPLLGIAPDELLRLEQQITHVIHCAASVSFEDTYEQSYRTNTAGTLNALAFSLHLQRAPNSPFVTHIGIETSYIHGRQMREPAQEDAIVFPRNYYNNYYELTKAMASIETERCMIEQGLRVLQLCPAIVIGDLHTGNNRGDTKVVNAPINMFGRVREAIAEPQGKLVERSVAGLLARLACVFPGDPTAQLNLITVDWVVAGIIAALHHPEAVGERIHLAADKRLTPDMMGQILGEELGIKIRLIEPTLFRNLMLPVFTRLLLLLKQEKTANALGKLATLFGGYSEWEQPIHEVGNDIRVLKLPEPRPDMGYAFRMLCRHNRYVQDFGQVRDPAEISRREKLWQDFITELEQRIDRPVGTLSAADFQAEAAANLPFVHKTG